MIIPKNGSRMGRKTPCPIPGHALGGGKKCLGRCTVPQQIVFDEATRPYQFALSTRTGTDSLAAMLRAATELDPEATVVSLDGRSAYDSVSRAAMLGKLKHIAPQILPFVRSLYAPRTSGGMTRAIATGSSRPNGSSKVILLRRRYSRLASMMRSQQRHDSLRQKNSWAKRVSIMPKAAPRR